MRLRVPGQDDRPTPRPAPPGSGGWIRRLSPFLLVHRRDVGLALGASIAGQAATALRPLIQKVLIDDVLVAGRRPLAPWLTLLVLAGVVGFGFAALRRVVGGRVSLAVQFDLRQAIFDHLQRLDPARHDQLRTGQLVSRASSDVGLLQGLLSFLPIMLGNVVLFVVALVVMVVLSPPLTLVALAAVPALLVVALRLRTRIFPASWDAQQRAGEVAGVVDEAVTGIRVVKGFGQEERELERLAGTGRSLFASRARLISLQARLTPAMQAIPVLAQVAVLAYGGWLALHGRLSLGTLLAFSSYMVQLVSPVRMFANLLAVGQQARAGGERLLDLLDAEPVVTEPDGAPDLPALEGEVRLEGVRFGYRADEPVLDGVDLRVAPGETVALVGGSGSGKTTIGLLLPRFYDVGAGRVLLDGHDVRSVSLASLRAQVGVVFEEPFLFSDSIRENIAYGRPDATDEEVEAAARVVEADGFIRRLPHGYDTVVGERGLTLSGGQRQRVALARVVLTDPRVLVLDDATSSIDARTEEEIHRALRAVLDRRTTILIAHRRSTVRLADRVVLLDGGRVADEGTHAELLARSPRYRELLAGPDPGDEAGGDGARDGAGAGAPAGVTPSAWPAVPDDELPVARADLAATAAGRGGRGSRGGGMGHGPGGGMDLAPTPELLAALDRLPPADADPRVDVAREAAPAPFALRRFLHPHRWALGAGLVLVVADTALTLAGPLLVRRGIDLGVRPGDEGALRAAALMFLAVAVADWAVVSAYTLVTGRTAERLLFALRVRIFAHLMRLSLGFYDREMAGRVMTRMTTDVEALSQLLQTGLIQAVVSICTSVGVLVLLVALSPSLALAAALVLPLLAAATIWYRRRSSVAYASARDAIGAVNADFQENLAGVRLAQAHGREDRNIGRFRAINARYAAARFESQRLISLYFPFVLLLSDLAAAAVLGAGAGLVDDGAVTAGVVIAVLLYLDQFFSPIQQLSQVFDTWQQASASLEKIDELMATPTGTPPPARPVTLPALRGEIAFDGVRFTYPGTDEEALAGVDLRVAAGQTVALVGETGAGKSTIVKLVARFYDPTEGRVLLDGVDLRDLDPDSYRRRLGVVPQEAFLFTGTIADNIAYGRPDATDAEVEAAARAVGAHDFIAAQAGGYRAPVAERGRSLSAGQRQLIALARARLVDPVILILDEATSNLDLGTEARVQRAMGIVARGRTTLLVAHRLTTAMGADRILVVDGGRVVEEGAHEELLDREGRYAALWAAFAGGAGDLPLVPAPAGGPGVALER